MKKCTKLSALPLILVALALAIFAPGCAVDGTGSPDTTAESHTNATVVTITAHSLDNLQPGEQLVLDTRDLTKIFHFDTSVGAIDFSRITMICPNGQQMQADQWLLKQQKEQNADVASMVKSGFTVGGDTAAVRSYEATLRASAKSAATSATSSPGYAPQDDIVGVCVIFICDDGLVVIVCVFS